MQAKEVLMNKQHNIPLSKLINEFNLNVVYLPVEAEKILVNSPELSRPDRKSVV